MLNTESHLGGVLEILKGCVNEISNQGHCWIYDALGDSSGSGLDLIGTTNIALQTTRMNRG